MYQLRYRVLKDLEDAMGRSHYYPGDIIMLTPQAARALTGRVRLLDSDAPEMAPVTVVDGVGPERERGLARLGILTVAGLANADPIEVEIGMVNVSPEMVQEWQAEARAFLENQGGKDNEEVTSDG